VVWLGEYACVLASYIELFQKILNQVPSIIFWQLTILLTPIFCLLLPRYRKATWGEKIIFGLLGGFLAICINFVIMLFVTWVKF
jgi:hypothetical protein